MSSSRADHGTEYADVAAEHPEEEPPLKKARKHIGHDAHRARRMETPINNSANVYLTPSVRNIYGVISKFLGSVRDFVMSD